MQISILVSGPNKKKETKQNPKPLSSCNAGIGSTQEEWACLGRKVGAWQPPKRTEEGHKDAGARGQMKEPLRAEHVHLAA